MDPRKVFYGNLFNFNEPPTMWNGQKVFNTSNLHGHLNVVKHPKEPFIPNINTDGNVNVKKNVNVKGNVNADGNVKAKKEVYSNNGKHRLSSKKNFDIPHPTKEGWRLTHSCVEGPEAAVYIRGKLINTNTIKLPEYWEKLVDPNTITISVTPIGSHQNIFVKEFDSKEVVLESTENISIHCFYHIFGERIDTERLIVEYEGDIEDYPGDNSERSIAGYHYDKKVI